MLIHRLRYPMILNAFFLFTCDFNRIIKWNKADFKWFFAFQLKIRVVDLASNNPSIAAGFYLSLNDNIDLNKVWNGIPIDVTTGFFDSVYISKRRIP